MKTGSSGNNIYFQLSLSILIVVLGGCLLFAPNLPLAIVAFSLMSVLVAGLFYQIVRGRSHSKTQSDKTSEREAAAHAAQRRFMARVSHELRTPLTIIKGENQVLLARRRSLEEYEQQILSNLEEVAKMERVIDDLLMFSQYESGMTEMPMRRVALDDIVADSMNDLRRDADERSLEMIGEMDHAEILCDPPSVSRLVCKLIENAIQYSRPGGKVYVRIRNGGGHVILEVEDNGIGIPQSELGQVFERFYRGSNARDMRERGSGIGLSLAHTIAELHGATMSVQSEVNVGTKFTVRFRA